MIINFLIIIQGKLWKPTDDDSKEYFGDIRNEMYSNVEVKLDEADQQAAVIDERLSHESVFKHSARYTTEQVGKLSVKVVTQDSALEKKSMISKNDQEMDDRAVAAVKAAIHKAKTCKKPTVKYDSILEKAYVEYADGKKTYVD